MHNPTCPECEMTDVADHPEHWECMTCGHEWPHAAKPVVASIVKDALGNVLVDGDIVVLIKALSLKGAQILKDGTKTKLGCRS